LLELSAGRSSKSLIGSDDVNKFGCSVCERDDSRASDEPLVGDALVGDAIVGDALVDNAVAAYRSCGFIHSESSALDFAVLLAQFDSVGLALTICGVT
jgi:hypothetical protein